MRGVMCVALLAALFAPSIAAAQYRSPGAAFSDGLERYQLCRDIVRAGGRCPDESVPMAQVREYYQRLVDANWAKFRAEQQRVIEQAQLEQRITNTLTAALQLQEKQFRQMLETVQTDLADARQQLSLNSGGWILWNRTAVMSEQDKMGKGVTVSSVPSWEPGQGFDQLANCRQEAADTIRAHASSAEKDTTHQMVLSSAQPSDSSALVQLMTPAGGKRSIEITVVCFPGEFDPRPNGASSHLPAPPPSQQTYESTSARTTKRPSQTVRPNSLVNIEGFTPDKVRAALGPPSLTDNTARWITWFYDTPQGTLKVFFVQGKATLQQP